MSRDVVFILPGLAASAGWLLWTAYLRRHGAIRRSDSPVLFWTTLSTAGIVLAALVAAGAGAAYRLVNPSLADRAAALYPTRAVEQNLPGLVILHCTVTPTYGVKDCRVASETPAGMGFGASALQISALERLPEKDRGRARPGQPINLPIRFKMPDQKP